MECMRVTVLRAYATDQTTQRDVQSYTKAQP